MAIPMPTVSTSGAPYTAGRAASDVTSVVSMLMAMQGQEEREKDRRMEVILPLLLKMEHEKEMSGLDLLSDVMKFNITTNINKSKSLEEKIDAESNALSERFGTTYGELEKAQKLSSLPSDNTTANEIFEDSLKTSLATNEILTNAPEEMQVLRDQVNEATSDTRKLSDKLRFMKDIESGLEEVSRVSESLYDVAKDKSLLRFPSDPKNVYNFFEESGIRDDWEKLTDEQKEKWGPEDEGGGYPSYKVSREAHYRGTMEMFPSELKPLQTTQSYGEQSFITGAEAKAIIPEIETSLGRKLTKIERDALPEIFTSISKKFMGVEEASMGLTSAFKKLEFDKEALSNAREDKKYALGLRTERENDELNKRASKEIDYLFNDIFPRFDVTNAESITGAEDVLEELGWGRGEMDYFWNIAMGKESTDVNDKAAAAKQWASYITQVYYGSEEFLADGTRNAYYDQTGEDTKLRKGLESLGAFPSDPAVLEQIIRASNEFVETLQWRPGKDETESGEQWTLESALDEMNAKYQDKVKAMKSKANRVEKLLEETGIKEKGKKIIIEGLENLQGESIETLINKQLRDELSELNEQAKLIALGYEVDMSKSDIKKRVAEISEKLMVPIGFTDEVFGYGEVSAEDVLESLSKIGAPETKRNIETMRGRLETTPFEEAPGLGF